MHSNKLPDAFTAQTIILHRGNHGESPFESSIVLPEGFRPLENTIDAFILDADVVASKKLGFEFDVVEGNRDLFVFHDKNLTRMTNGRVSDSIASKTWHDLQEPKMALGRNPEERKVFIPTLEQVLEVLPSGAPLLLEIKSPKIPPSDSIRADQGIAFRTAGKVAKLVAQDKSLIQRLCVQAFGAETLRAFIEHLRDEVRDDEVVKKVKTSLLIGVEKESVPAYDRLKGTVYKGIETFMWSTFERSNADVVSLNHEPLTSKASQYPGRVVFEWTALSYDQIMKIQANGHIPIANPAAFLA